MLQTNLPTVAELMSRYETACTLKQAVSKERITSHLTAWLAGISDHKLPIKFLENSEMLIGAARDARDAWDARDARDARAAWDARAARDARTARAARDAWAARDCSWNAIAAIGAIGINNRETFGKWMPMFEAFEAGAFALWVTQKEIAVAILPIVSTESAPDNRRRLHNPAGPAFSWLSDIRDYYWHGVNVPAQVIEAPQSITVDQVEKERNAEVRRVMIERYGQERYLLSSGAKEVSRDEFGVLYRKDLPDDEPLVMVQVINSTPEPDGSRKTYHLRVPPTIRTPREAIAWTFEMPEKAYQPRFES